MFSIFNSKRRIFKSKLLKAAKATKIIGEGVFANSLVLQNKAKKELTDISIWWENNVEEYKKELTINEDDFELMRKFLQLPNSSKYRNLNGKKNTYHPNGRIEYEFNYADGAKSGIQKGWYENGQLSFEHHYINDHMDGLQRSWFENGNLESENNYKFSTANTNRLSDSIGWQKEYYQNGFLKKEEYYNEITFKLEKIKCYGESGSIEESRDFIGDELVCREYDNEGIIIKEWRNKR